MAKPLIATVKTQAAAIATALNAALGDDTLTGIAVGWQHPQHPMRKWQNLVKMDNAGTFTANDAYIDQAYNDKVYTTSYAQKDDRTTNDPA